MQIPHRYHITSTEQNRRMDSKTIHEFGIDGFTLMEIAGTRAADYIMQHSETGSKVLLVCGKGNNAGDAFVVGRILSQQGYKCSYFLCFGDENLSTDAQKNYELLLKLDSDLPIIAELSELNTKNYVVIVDGIFGTGLSSEVRSPIDEVIDLINSSTSTVFALDIPSGLSSDTGRIMGTAVLAHHTLSFGALKAGSFLNEGKEICGEVVLCDLPFPNKYREHAGYLIDEDWVELNSILKQQREHKYADGMLYIIAGSEGLTGAAILAAKSAWAQELGAVTVITPKALLDIYEKTLIQIIKKPVGNSSDTHFTNKHLDDVLEILQQKKGTILIGPGLGRELETLEFVQSLLKQYDGNAVIDADALFALDEVTIQYKPSNAEWILTPHPGELARLLPNADALKDDFNRMIQICAFAKKHGISILSKGYPGILASKNGEAFLTTYNTRIFTRAGFGDVLAGKVGAFWLTDKEEIIACCKAFIHGQQKAQLFIQVGKTTPEPLDII